MAAIENREVSACVVQDTIAARCDPQQLDDTRVIVRTVDDRITASATSWDSAGHAVTSPARNLLQALVNKKLVELCCVTIIGSITEPVDAELRARRSAGRDARARDIDRRADLRQRRHGGRATPLPAGLGARQPGHQLVTATNMDGEHQLVRATTTNPAERGLRAPVRPRNIAEPGG